MRSVQITAAEWAEEGEEGIPRRVQVAIDVQNNGAATIIREGRLRVSYSGRTVLMLTLDEQVKIPRRYDGEVLAWLRVNVARNSQSVAFSSALKRHDTQNMEVDWEFSARTGAVKFHITQPRRSFAEVLPSDVLAELWSIVEEMKEER